MQIDTLNQRFAIPGLAEFHAGKGHLPVLHIRNAAAEARISVYAGQVLSYRPRATDRELLFLGEHAHYARGKAIKGGVPICWPWFGPDPHGEGRPAHGIARTRLWQVHEVRATAEDMTEVVLGFDADDDSRAIWPHEFSLRLHVHVGASLGLALETTNDSKVPFDITQALHTYFQVGDIAATLVEGLDGAAYTDKAHGGRVMEQSGPVRFAGEVDSVYADVGPHLAVVDTAMGRRIEIDSDGSSTAVVWNPWSEIAAAMADLGDDDYRRFVCVETANAGAEVVRVAPGATARLAATYRDCAL